MELIKYNYNLAVCTLILLEFWLISRPPSLRINLYQNIQYWAWSQIEQIYEFENWIQWMPKCKNICTHLTKVSTKAGYWEYNECKIRMVPWIKDLITLTYNNDIQFSFDVALVYSEMMDEPKVHSLSRRMILTILMKAKLVPRHRTIQQNRARIPWLYD